MEDTRKDFGQTAAKKRKVSTITTYKKRSNLRVYGTEEDEIQTKGRENQFNEVTANFPNLEKEMDIRTHGVFTTPNKHGQRIAPQYIMNLLKLNKKQHVS